jgi:hypothetical protein
MDVFNEIDGESEQGEGDRAIEGLMEREGQSKGENRRRGSDGRGGKRRRRRIRRRRRRREWLMMEEDVFGNAEDLRG